MASKKDLAMVASKQVYQQWGPKVIASSKSERSKLKDEAHKLALQAAQAVDPNIDPVSLKRQSGIYFRQKKSEVSESSITKIPAVEEDDSEIPNIVKNIETPKEQPDEEPKIPQEIQDYIQKTLAASEKNSLDSGKKIIKVKANPPDPRIIKGASDRAVEKVIVQFDAVIEKIFLDDYRKALFSSWKTMTGYEGDLGDFIIEAFDLFFEIKGIDLEIVQHRPLSVDKGRIKHV